MKKEMVFELILKRPLTTSKKGQTLVTLDANTRWRCGIKEKEWMGSLMLKLHSNSYKIVQTAGAEKQLENLV